MIEFLKLLLKQIAYLFAYLLGRKQASQEIESVTLKQENEALTNGIQKREEIHKMYDNLRANTPNDWDELRKRQDEMHKTP